MKISLSEYAFLKYIEQSTPLMENLNERQKARANKLCGLEFAHKVTHYGVLRVSRANLPSLNFWMIKFTKSEKSYLDELINTGGIDWRNEICGQKKRNEKFLTAEIATRKSSWKKSSVDWIITPEAREFFDKQLKLFDLER